ncbi:small multidrug resistance protein [Alcanivorax sp. S71-1-4]|jgi:quaternary ammonium compound-resistance protein SugE|uniref:DMT family transporter n=1 Tax=Alcanivorax sp. S71-1-4 TaxID=1177159 RepID=UPI001356F2D8|nr:multidrug efflux SMR transporter [Alcanivorax sp. S71-1-4]KAF0810775.1 small multidrug resistance protein [Alcanivorax sp. S71-1-4]
MSIYWVVLLAAVLVEIGWALSLKWMQVTPGPLSIGTVVVLTLLNMVMLSFAMRGIPVGTAYAVWTGLGAVGITVASIWLYHDPVTPLRFVFIALIIGGVVGLKATSVA